MEFPNLGRRCGVASCGRLDFLPFTCHPCGKTFCEEHRKAATHDCPHPELDAVVPNCPMCGQIIAVKAGDDPNVNVERHISSGCPKQESKALRTNACSFGKCKKKELIPIICPACQKKFCLRHRHTQDHKCQPRNNALRAAEKRVKPASLMKQPTKEPQKTKPSAARVNQRNGRQQAASRQQARQASRHQPRQAAGLSEDEALQMAMALSLQESQGQSNAQPVRAAQQTNDAGSEDPDLQRAIAASLREQEQPKSQSGCEVC